MGRRLQRGLRFEPPMVLADQLEKRLAALPQRARELAIELLAPAVAAGDESGIARALEEIEARLEAEARAVDVEAQARDTAARASTLHRKAFFVALGAAVGMKVLGSDDPDDGAAIGNVEVGVKVATRSRGGVLVAKLSAEPRLIAEKFATENAKLIRSLQGEIVPALRDEVVRAVEFDIPAEEAAERLISRWKDKGVPVAHGRLESRLRTITRDQIAKLNTDLTKARQTSAGITQFRWRSQRDGRVRPLHARIDGNVYDWATGHPTEGLPGQPILCRCFPEAVVDPEAVLNAPGLVHLSTAAAALELAA